MKKIKTLHALYGVKTLNPTPKDILAEALTKDDEKEIKQETEEAYDDLLTIFLSFSKVLYVDGYNWNLTAEMALKRAEGLLMMASKGYKIDLILAKKQQPF